MYYGVEGCTFFFDCEVVYVGFRLSDFLKLWKGFGKRILWCWLVEHLFEVKFFSCKCGFMVLVGEWVYV